MEAADAVSDRALRYRADDLLSSKEPRFARTARKPRTAFASNGKWQNRVKRMGKYKRGDYVKVEFPYESGGPSEWLWVLVDHSDDEQRLVFGKLDNEPIVIANLRLGQEVAVSYNTVREHRTPESFIPM